MGHRQELSAVFPCTDGILGSGVSAVTADDLRQRILCQVAAEPVVTELPSGGNEVNLCICSIDTAVYGFIHNISSSIVFGADGWPSPDF